MAEQATFPDYEAKWQKRWAREAVDAPSDTGKKGEKDFYILSMFPYPSGKLHFGHALPYTLTDAVARYKRMNGFTVLHPTGWDAFGLPAENAAIANNIHPARYTETNIEEMRKQMNAFGYSFNWDRELYTCREDYYKWTQWLFLRMLEKGTAYRKNARVNWCTQCLTVLANEQVETILKRGEEFQACFRCESRVEQKEISAWYLRITDYSDRLLQGLDDLGESWPEKVSSQQRYWIGRSQGVEIDFRAKLKTGEEKLTVFTTRADTVFGVTFVALAVEHPLIQRIIAEAEPTKAKQLTELVSETLEMSERDRSRSEVKEGIDTGLKAINPLNGEEVPLFVANYVLMYGTGAVMAVPGHDERDHGFAKEHELPIRQVIQPEDGEADIEAEAFTGHGVLIDSGEYTGLRTPEAIAKIAADLKSSGRGGPRVNYKLRDWGISRQRYWGCPIPVVHCPDCGIVPVPDNELPIRLPDDVDFLPTGQSPLTTHPDFKRVKCPKCAREDARRDMDTMDTFVDSSWYFLRYLDPNNSDRIFDPDKIRRWAPVDLYIGGREHAILHLIYARFYTMFCHEIGLIDFDEPFSSLYAHGLIQGESLKVVNEHMNRYVTPAELEELATKGKAKKEDVTRRIEKMSKSKKNGADPTVLVDRYGADAVRLTILFLGPGDADSVWDPRGIMGPFKFVKRWHDTVLEFAPLVEDLPDLPPDAVTSDGARKLRSVTHVLVDKVTREFEGRFAFNTAIARAMELVNEIRSFVAAERLEGPCSGSDDPALASRHALAEAFQMLCLTMAPFAPHTAEETHSALGHRQSIFSRGWPKADRSLMVLDEIELPVTVNGKVRATIRLSRDADQAEMERAALADESVQRAIGGKSIKRLITVPGRIVNVVTG